MPPPFFSENPFFVFSEIPSSHPLPNSRLLCSGKEKPKNLCNKDFAELSGELSGAICLKTLVLLGSALELLRKLFGAVRADFLALGFFLALNMCPVFAAAFSDVICVRVIEPPDDDAWPY